MCMHLQTCARGNNSITMLATARQFLSQPATTLWPRPTFTNLAMYLVKFVTYLQIR